ncbi:MAG: Nif3-like dinuclear metal center hexameric protein [Bacteroidetes bacterium]|nr:Nif3-like dinuclear metal center hexameric protein [Bacteroidota bacterium]
MKLAKITQLLEEFAPLSLQEHYDNSGLIIGNPTDEIRNALICIDITEEVIDEAKSGGFNLIISHHPLIFKEIKKLNKKPGVEQIIVDCIKNDIAIYAMHTNVDNIKSGVNGVIADKIGLINTSTLSEKSGLFRKLVTFCPAKNAEKLRSALFEQGAGQQGNYDCCSFNMTGTGTFKGNDNAKPFIGEKNIRQTEQEIRIETIYPVHKEKSILSALINTHPYEEVAYDIFTLENTYNEFGAGIIGELNEEIGEIAFLKKLKTVFGVKIVKHSTLLNKPIKKVAVCGGSGSFLISVAKAREADIFISGDIKYHDFFEAHNKLLIADIGHYESEQFTKELIHTILIKKFPNFALRISEINTNPIQYY